MTEIVLLLLFCIFLYTLYVSYIQKKSIIIPHETTGKIYKGVGMAKQLNFPTINMILDNPVPCGIYLADTKYGKITMIVGRTNQKNAECNFHNFSNEITNQDVITIINIQKIYIDGDFLNTFYCGCDS